MKDKEDFKLPAQFKECEGCANFDALFDESKAHCHMFGWINGVQKCRRKAEYVYFGIPGDRIKVDN